MSLQKTIYLAVIVTLGNNIVSSIIEPPPKVKKERNILSTLTSRKCEGIYRTYSKLIINDKPVSQSLREEYEKCNQTGNSSQS